MILGITGTDGAGKGTVVDYLVDQHQFMHYGSRAVLVQELTSRGLHVDREHMREMANELRRTHGNDFLVRVALRAARERNEENIIIESIRALAEVETLKANSGVLLGVDADSRVRFERIQARASESDRVSFEQFLAHEALEMNDPDPNGMQKAAVIAAADAVILNNGSREELHTQIEQVLATLNFS